MSSYRHAALLRGDDVGDAQLQTSPVSGVASEQESDASVQPAENPPPLSGFQACEEAPIVVSLRDASSAEEAYLFGASLAGKHADASLVDRGRESQLSESHQERRGRGSGTGTHRPSSAAPATPAGSPHIPEGPVMPRAGPTEEQSDLLHALSPAPKREKFEHEQDHDSCPFVAIRKTEWFIRFLDRIRRTSPMDLNKILASFSIKNDFMFYPPPKTYRFLLGEDGGVTVGESAERCDSEDDEARLRREQEHLRLRKPHGKKRRIDYEAPPELDPRKQVGATHGISGLGTYMTVDRRSTKFEMAFIPWNNEIQTYRIEKDEVILERKITVGGSLFAFSLGCPIPCSIIRPNCRMSSHVALFFHCNGEDIGHSSCMRLQTLANALHVTVLVPEYPGYGLFRGSPSEATVKGAMERVVQFLLSVDGSLTPSRLLLIGHSIGSAVAIHIAAYIQEVFERMQAHYASDVACPAAYSNELAHHGKPTFFEAFQRAQADEAADARRGSSARRRPTATANASFADDDADDDEVFARRGAEEQCRAAARHARRSSVVHGSRAERVKEKRSRPLSPTSQRREPVSAFSPAAKSTDRKGVPLNVSTSTTNEPFGSVFGDRAGQSWSGGEEALRASSHAVDEREDEGGQRTADSMEHRHREGSLRDSDRGDVRRTTATAGTATYQGSHPDGGAAQQRSADSATEVDSVLSKDDAPYAADRARHPCKTNAFCLPCYDSGEADEGTVKGDGGAAQDDDEEQSGTDEGFFRGGCCSCGGCIGRKSRFKPSTVTHCRHNALGGIILISSFTALRCVEYVPTFKKTYNLHTTQLEVRRRQIPCDTVFPAPVDWRRDASARVPPEDIHFDYEEMTTPLLFKLSRFLSFNRFPTVDVACRLQETYHYFNHTPLLLIHGTDDELISPIHSVALASKLRQCRNGGTSAQVFLSFLSGGGHNELPCIREIRRFYKDQILKPHLHRQEKLKRKLTELYNSGREQMVASHRDGTPLRRRSAAPSLHGNESVKAGGPESRADTPPPPPAELYFLSHFPASATRSGSALSSPRLPAAESHHHFHHSHEAHHPSGEQPNHGRGHRGSGADHRRGSSPSHHDRYSSGAITRETSYIGAASFAQDATASTAPHHPHHAHPHAPHGCAAGGPGPRDDPLHGRTNGSLRVRDKDVYGPFIHREHSAFTEPDDPDAAVKNSSLLHTLEQTQRVGQHPDEAAFAPAATMLHMSMFPTLDKYDVGSVLVAAVRANALPKQAASALYTRHHRLAWLWRVLVASMFLLGSMVVLAIGITHTVLCRPDYLRPHVPPGHDVHEYKRDNRILAWSVLVAVFLAIIFFLRLLSPMFGLSNVSKERERHHHATFHAFSILNLVAGALDVGFSIIMGFILAFTPHERGGVNWHRWSALPYHHKVWISFVPRWLMVGIACWHCVVLVFYIAKNH